MRARARAQARQERTPSLFNLIKVTLQAITQKRDQVPDDVLLRGDTKP